MNPLPASELSLEQKIWRYMDLTRFLLLLARGSLFFASLSQLDDPYEGYMPRSHVKEWSAILGKHFQDIARLKAEVAASGRAGVAKAFDTIEADLRQNMTFRGIGAMFGVSCWHANDYESEAMWKVYSIMGAGVAIESTVERLRDVLAPTEGVTINRVKYEDFDTAPIVRDTDPHILTTKRWSFEHEHEVRAMIPLPRAGEGIEIPCDLDRLIVRVHVAPTASLMFLRAVEVLCSGIIQGRKFETLRSRLFEPPDYDLVP